MNIILLTENDFVEPGIAQLNDHRLHHIARVLRVETGATLRVGQLDGLIGTATVLAIDSHAVKLSVSVEQQPPAPLALTLVLALPRPKMLKRILRTAGELGIKTIHLINSYRVEKSYWQSPLLGGVQHGIADPDSLLQHYYQQGLEQAIDTVRPQIELHDRFRPFVEDRLPTFIADQYAWIAHPSAARSTKAHGATPDNNADQAPQLVCIGPEGGWIDYEVDKLVDAGCRVLDLGARIYRVETALPVITATLLARYGLATIDTQ